MADYEIDGKIYMRDEWIRFLELLAEHGPAAPGRIAYFAGLTGGGRTDNTVRAAFSALERRGLCKRSSWLQRGESWSVTEEGHRELAEHAAADS